MLGVIGNVHERAVPLRCLVAPLGLVAAGLVIVNAGVFAAPGQEEAGEVIAGIACSCAALLIWVGYAVVNARVTRSADAPGSLPWTGLQGLGAGLGAIMLVPLLGDTMPIRSLDDPQTARFLAWSLVLGLAGSWLATWLWVVASRRLPLALSAQLIVAETLFGLGYGFLYEARWPDATEALGAGLQIVGVVLAIETFRRTARVNRAPSGGPPVQTAPSA